MVKKGFTYVEVMVGVSLFMLMSIFIMRMDTLAGQNIKKNNEAIRMMYIAQSQLEEYKSNPHEYEDKLVEGFYVTIRSTPFGGDSIVDKVTVTVKKSPSSPADEDVVIKCHLLKS